MKDTAIWSALTFLFSIATSLAIVSFNMGRMRERISMLETALAQKADHADIVAIKEALAEIKGMFVLKLRE